MRKLLKEEKLAFLMDLYLKEYPYSQMQKLFADKLKETERSARNWIKKLNNQLEKEGEADRLKAKKKALKQYNMLYNMLILEDNAKEAAAILEKN